MRKKLWISVFSIVLLLFLLFLIRPVKHLEDSENVGSSSSIANNIKTVGVSMDKKKRKIELDFAMDENQINRIIRSIFFKEGNANAAKVELAKKSITFYMNHQIFGLIPTQYSVVIAPSIEGKRLYLYIEKVAIGHIPIPTGYMLNDLKRDSNPYYKIDKEKSRIEVLPKLPSSIHVNSIQVDSTSIRLKSTITIQSWQDIIELFNFGLPSDVTKALKGLLF